METLILVNVPGVSREPTPAPNELSSRGFAPRDLLITVASPDVAPAADLTRAVVREDADPPPELQADQAGLRAQLLGRYMGQVKARIERAWLRPRTPIGSDLFRCRVAIEQDRTGAVGTVTLLDCNGDGDWQQSLVRAIYTASPLSAPPDPAVFSRTLALTFTSLPHGDGRGDDGFEPEPVRLVQSSSLTRTIRNGVVDLRITGSPASSMPFRPDDVNADTSNAREPPALTSTEQAADVASQQ